uniref:HTH_Tnp_Tc3_2 domain-containing protein n=1 Tax=Caenorhabditis japonica TaxID=281687 RepID=A0A8R1HQH6_CAEJA
MSNFPADFEEIGIDSEKQEIESQATSESVHQLDLSSEALVTSTLNIRGNKIITAIRPGTSPYRREVGVSRENLRSGSPDSVAATYTIRENRSERQTKVKLESLERRLKANEKARKEIEAEAEKWKERANKNSKRLPELEMELAETVQAKEEWQAKSQELEVHNRQLSGDLGAVQIKLEETENSLKMFQQKVSSVLNIEKFALENEGEMPVELTLNDLEQEILKYQAKCVNLEKENSDLKEQLHELTSSLTQNQNHVSTLMGHLENNKTQSREMHGICRKELEMRQDRESRINHDATLLSSTINEQKMELEMLKSEIRCLRSYSQEISTSNKNNIILLKSAETERKSLLETLTVLLNSEEEPTENNIKRTIRDLVREKNSEQTKRFEAEKAASSAEGVLLEQAKQQRSALFRARVSEEECSKSAEKIDELEQELLASDLERKNLEHKIENLEKCVTKVSSLLNVNTGTIFDPIFDRIEELVAQESVYRVVVNENRLISENIIRGLQSVRKDIKGSGNEGKKSGPANAVVATAAKIISNHNPLHSKVMLQKPKYDIFLWCCPKAELPERELVRKRTAPEAEPARKRTARMRTGTNANWYNKELLEAEPPELELVLKRTTTNENSPVQNRPS